MSKSAIGDRFQNSWPNRKRVVSMVSLIDWIYSGDTGQGRDHGSGSHSVPSIHDDGDEKRKCSSGNERIPYRPLVPKYDDSSPRLTPNSPACTSRTASMNAHNVSLGISRIDSWSSPVGSVSSSNGESGSNVIPGPGSYLWHLHDQRHQTHRRPMEPTAIATRGVSGRVRGGPDPPQAAIRPP